MLSCVGYVVCFLQVFDRAPIRFGARVALSELAFGAAVALGGAGSVAVGAWLLIERGARPGRVAERSAVLFLLTSAINLITLALAGLGLWAHVLPGKHDPLLSLLPGGVGVVVFVGFLLLPWVTDRTLGARPCGRIGNWSRATSETIRDTRKLLFSATGGCSGRSATCGSTSRCCGSASTRWGTRRRSRRSSWPTRSATSRT